MHVAVFFHRFGPYHRARLEGAGGHVNVTGIEVSGHTSEYDWEAVDAGSSFERVCLFPDRYSEDVSTREVATAVREALSEVAPEVVAVHGWSTRSALAVTWACTRMGLPTVVMSESTAYDAERSWIRERVKRRIVGLHQAALVGGTPHAAYLRQLGFADDRIFKGYDAVENEYFAEGAETARDDAEATRASYGLPEQYILASARFLPKKNLSGLLRAYAAYREKLVDEEALNLVILGDGPLREKIEATRVEYRLEDCVHLPGFKQYDELPVYYGLAEFFVHASTTEQWGLVVNEAMAAGLPVLVSERCGCARDLVEDGENGYTFDPHDTAELTDLLVKMTRLSKRDTYMADASRRIIERWGPHAFGEGLKKAAQAALGEQPTGSWIDQLLLKTLMYR
jgi:glycosyltransferase involved in cell wall biosynthesis